MTRPTVSYLAAMSLALTAAGPATRAVRADDKNVLHLTAFAVDLGSSPTSPVAAGARSGTLDIATERFFHHDPVPAIRLVVVDILPLGQPGFAEMLDDRTVKGGRGCQVEQAVVPQAWWVVGLVEQLGQPPVGVQIVIRPTQVLDISCQAFCGEHLRVERDFPAELLDRQRTAPDSDQGQ